MSARVQACVNMAAVGTATAMVGCHADADPVCCGSMGLSGV